MRHPQASARQHPSREAQIRNPSTQWGLRLFVMLAEETTVMNLDNVMDQLDTLPMSDATVLIPSRPFGRDETIPQSGDRSTGSIGLLNEGRIAECHARFCDLLNLAERELASDNVPAAVAVLQIAARYAFPGNAGVFGSRRLESLLLEAGKQIPSPTTPRDKSLNGTSLRVLHVLSYGKPVGGDTRCVWRWIQEDHENQHSVAITTQADVEDVYDIPEVLRNSAKQSGGTLHNLSAETSDPLLQARELRRLCQDVNVVVLHVFPYDVVPVLALAAGCEGVKTLFVNHSDHTFWIGAGVAHSVVHLRKQSEKFLRERRGLEAQDSPVLGIPLPRSATSTTNSEARQALGIKADTVLLLTVASPFKYSAPGSIGFLDLVKPVLDAFPQASLIAIGPTCKEAWQAVSEATNGRVLAMGTRWDTDLYYAAADIYLDSVPFSSITSLLEAGSRGVPLLGYRVSDDDMSLLGPGAPGIDETMIIAEDSAEYQAQLSRLISDTAYRQQCGRRVRDEIIEHHTGSKWAEGVRRQYSIAMKSPQSRGCVTSQNDRLQATSLNIALTRLYPEWQLRKLFAKYLGTLSYGSRVATTLRLYSRGFELCYWNLLPRSMKEIARQARKRTKSVFESASRRRGTIEG